ncbi:hypothetical protein ACIBKX_07860 [Streptomyces sp. NPDC050658]|uniref:hypothetical protein n=1 Tax=unclassified Streptomyces TaxID=2593676 RepID=UPI00342C9210
MDNSTLGVTAERMAQVAPDDFLEIRRVARAYCRAVDATRSRKRMDGSATVVRGGQSPYGTDDVSDDVTQDAVLLFAKRLGEVSAKCEPAAVRVSSRETVAWQYVRRDGETIVVDRKRIQYWAVRDAAASNGYRLDAKPDDIDAAPGRQVTRGISHSEVLATLATAPNVAANCDVIFRSAWVDGRAYPTLSALLHFAGTADDLGRAGVISRAAHALHGGPRHSSSKVQRTKDAAVREWHDLKAQLDVVRDELIYRGMRTGASA